MTILGRLQGIISLYENPCNEPWTVFATAALPWAGEPAMVLLGFSEIAPGVYSPLDPTQFVRNKIRAGRGRSSPHLRRRGNNSGEGGVELLDQVSEQAKIGPTDGILIEPTISTTETALWEIGGIVEHGAWQYMLIDQGSKFMYHSMATAHKSAYCEHWWDGDAYASGPFTPEPILGWQTVALLTDRYHHGATFPGHGQPFNDNPGTLHVECAWSGVLEPVPGIGYYGARLSASSAQGPMILAEQEIQAYASGETVSVAMSGNFPTPGIAHFEIYASGHWCIDTGANVMAQWTEAPRPATFVHPRTNKWHPKKPKHHHYLRNQTVWTRTEGSGSKQYNIDPEPPKKV